MNRQAIRSGALFLSAVMLLCGCHPTQPFYFKEDGDLSHYLDQATWLEDPDVHPRTLDEVHHSDRPLSVANPDFHEIWDLTLEDAMSIAMQNSKVIRLIGRAGATAAPFNQFTPDSLSANPDFAATVYGPAITETDPNFGVEAALAEFDAQFSTSAFWETTDRPVNRLLISESVFTQDEGVFRTGITKKAATGTEFAFRNEMIYTDNNNPSVVRPIPSDWFLSFEVEARQPLARGAGVQVNRAPIILARIRTDIELADFEANVRNLASDVEKAYWELHYQYRKLETSKVCRDSALDTWRRVDALAEQGAEGGAAADVAEARRQFFDFRAQVEIDLSDLFKSEARLRYLMGLAATDGRLIRPSDQPTTARIEFDWNAIRCESLVRSPELRRQKWRMKQRETELIAARHRLLPQINLVALYRWVGVGDSLISSDRRGLDFPDPGSTAWDVLTEGDFQEWRMGIEFTPPRFGARAELSAIRNIDLRLAREKAVLEDMELELIHQLTDAVHDLERHYALAQTYFNEWSAAKKAVDAITEQFFLLPGPVDRLLRAQERLCRAETQYYDAVKNYNLAILSVNFRKGSLLERNNIVLAEGPWPAKAYFDAHNLARRRDASYYTDYGFTRPRVISRGEHPQHYGDAEHVEGPTPAEEIPTPPPSGQPAGKPTTAESVLRSPAPTATRLEGPSLAPPNF
jgi:outer membrane protein TolC